MYLLINLIIYFSFSFCIFPECANQLHNIKFKIFTICIIISYFILMSIKMLWKFNYDFISLMFPREMQRCKFPRCGPARNGWTIEPRNKRKLFCRSKLARGKGLAISGYRSVIQLLDLHSAPSTIVPFFPSPPRSLHHRNDPAPTSPLSHPRRRIGADSLSPFTRDTMALNRR